MAPRDGEPWLSYPPDEWARIEEALAKAGAYIEMREKTVASDLMVFRLNKLREHIALMLRGQV